MTLHPEALKLLAEQQALNLPLLSEVSLSDARQRLIEPAAPVLPVQAVHDQEFAASAGPTRVRIYQPVGETDQRLSLIVFFHGGGWVIGNLDSHDGLCRQLATAAHAVVVSVDYRRAPESPFPAAVEDCLDALVWACGRRAEWQVNGAVCVAGDSAGGNLAAVVALRARDNNLVRIDYQVLLYPVTDCDLETASYRQFADGFGLTRDSMRWFWRQYLGDHDWTDPEASPLRAETLAGLPPACVVTAEYDPLRDEGEAYADRLTAAGVRVSRDCVKGVLHGFMLHGHRFQQVDEVSRRIGHEIRQIATV